MEPSAEAAALPARQRVSVDPRRLLFVAVPALLWAAYALLILGYAALRGLADGTSSPHDPIGLERALFRSVPTEFLQRHIYAHDVVWFDFGGFLLHAVWFALPLGFGIIVTLFERRRLAEYLAWLVTAAYLSDVFFAIVPTSPPWMSPGVHRILVERSFVAYTELDNNPFAAFPSLHAGFPLVIGLFFLLRCQRMRRLGWIAVTFSALIGFDVVYLGEHWVIDVVGGYALAALVAWLFTSSVVRVVLGRLPGDVLGTLSAANDAMSAYSRPASRTQDEPDEAFDLTRAA